MWIDEMVKTSVEQRPKVDEGQMVV